MGKYVYRIDKQINFKAINDYTFRAKRWFPDMFPHKTLIEKTKNTLSDEGIYRICFFANFSLANEYVNYLRTKSGGVLKSMLTSDIAIIDIEEYQIKHLKVVIKLL
ncbi:hypothetical protein ACYUPR_003916 [Proteus mirabilis]|uniref:hypothetical protein n=1 Tax=Proteus mirabilis TaxID=584 RepID=UPI003BF7E874